MCHITYVMLCILYVMHRVISHKCYIPIWYITVVYEISRFFVVYHTSAPFRSERKREREKERKRRERERVRVRV
jgi:hypothetical protein